MQFYRVGWFRARAALWFAAPGSLLDASEILERASFGEGLEHPVRMRVA